jgi:hypothetical protein
MINVLQIVPFKLGWTEKTPSNIMAKSTIVTLFFDEERRWRRLRVIQPLSQALPDAVEVVAACIVGTSLELYNSDLNRSFNVKAELIPLNNTRRAPLDCLHQFSS